MSLDHVTSVAVTPVVPCCSTRLAAGRADGWTHRLQPASRQHKDSTQVRFVVRTRHEISVAVLLVIQGKLDTVISLRALSVVPPGPVYRVSLGAQLKGKPKDKNRDKDDEISSLDVSLPPSVPPSRGATKRIGVATRPLLESRAGGANGEDDQLRFV